MAISIWQLLLVLIVVVLVFGTKKLRNIGDDLGNAVKGFKKGMRDDVDDEDKPANPPQVSNNQTIEGENKVRS